METDHHALSSNHRDSETRRERESLDAGLAMHEPAVRKSSTVDRSASPVTKAGHRGNASRIETAEEPCHPMGSTSRFRPYNLSTNESVKRGPPHSSLGGDKILVPRLRSHAPASGLSSASGKSSGDVKAFPNDGGSRLHRGVEYTAAETHGCHAGSLSGSDNEDSKNRLYRPPHARSTMTDTLVETESSPTAVDLPFSTSSGVGFSPTMVGQDSHNHSLHDDNAQQSRPAVQVAPQPLPGSQEEESATEGHNICDMYLHSEDACTETAVRRPIHDGSTDAFSRKKKKPCSSSTLGGAPGKGNYVDNAGHGQPLSTATSVAYLSATQMSSPITDVNTEELPRTDSTNDIHEEQCLASRRKSSVAGSIRSVSVPKESTRHKELLQPWQGKKTSSTTRRDASVGAMPTSGGRRRGPGASTVSHASQQQQPFVGSMHNHHGNVNHRESYAGGMSPSCHAIASMPLGSPQMALDGQVFNNGNPTAFYDLLAAEIGNTVPPSQSGGPLMGNGISSTAGTPASVHSSSGMAAMPSMPPPPLYDFLGIMPFYVDTCLTLSDTNRRHREALFEQVQTVVKQTLSQRAEVRVHGSISTDLALPSSDIDFLVVGYEPLSTLQAIQQLSAAFLQIDSTTLADMESKQAGIQAASEAAGTPPTAAPCTEGRIGPMEALDGTMTDDDLDNMPLGATAEHSHFKQRTRAGAGEHSERYGSQVELEMAEEVFRGQIERDYSFSTPNNLSILLSAAISRGPSSLGFSGVSGSRDNDEEERASSAHSLASGFPAVTSALLVKTATAMQGDGKGSPVLSAPVAPLSNTGASPMMAGGVALPLPDINSAGAPGVAPKHRGHLSFVPTHEGPMFFVQTITATRVPVIKVCAKSSGMKVDITFAGGDHWRSMQLTRKLLETYPQARPLILFLKHCVRCLGFGDTEPGGVTSFATYLMVLHYFNECKSKIISILRKREEALWMHVNRDSLSPRIPASGVAPMHREPQILHDDTEGTGTPSQDLPPGGIGTPPTGMEETVNHNNAESIRHARSRSSAPSAQGAGDTGVPPASSTASGQDAYYRAADSTGRVGRECMESSMKVLESILMYHLVRVEREHIHPMVQPGDNVATDVSGSTAYSQSDAQPTMSPASGSHSQKLSEERLRRVLAIEESIMSFLDSEGDPTPAVKSCGPLFSTTMRVVEPQVHEVEAKHPKAQVSPLASGSLRTKSLDGPDEIPPLLSSSAGVPQAPNSTNAPDFCRENAQDESSCASRSQSENGESRHNGSGRGIRATECRGDSTGSGDEVVKLHACESDGSTLLHQPAIESESGDTRSPTSEERRHAQLLNNFAINFLRYRVSLGQVFYDFCHYYGCAFNYESQGIHFDADGHSWVVDKPYLCARRGQHFHMTSPFDPEYDITARMTYMREFQYLCGWFTALCMPGSPSSCTLQYILQCISPASAEDDLLAVHSRFMESLHCAPYDGDMSKERFPSEMTQSSQAAPASSVPASATRLPSWQQHPSDDTDRVSQDGGVLESDKQRLATRESTTDTLVFKETEEGSRLPVSQQSLPLMQETLRSQDNAEAVYRDPACSEGCDAVNLLSSTIAVHSGAHGSSDEHVGTHDGESSRCTFVAPNAAPVMQHGLPEKVRAGDQAATRRGKQQNMQGYPSTGASFDRHKQPAIYRQHGATPTRQNSVYPSAPNWGAEGAAQMATMPSPYHVYNNSMAYMQPHLATASPASYYGMYGAHPGNDIASYLMQHGVAGSDSVVYPPRGMAFPCLQNLPPAQASTMPTLNSELQQFFWEQPPYPPMTTGYQHYYDFHGEQFVPHTGGSHTRHKKGGRDNAQSQGYAPWPQAPKHAPQQAQPQTFAGHWGGGPPPMVGGTNFQTMNELASQQVKGGLHMFGAGEDNTSKDRNDMGPGVRGGNQRHLLGAKQSISSPTARGGGSRPRFSYDTRTEVPHQWRYSHQPVPQPQSSPYASGHSTNPRAHNQNDALTPTAVPLSTNPRRQPNQSPSQHALSTVSTNTRMLQGNMGAMVGVGERTSPRSTSFHSTSSGATKHSDGDGLYSGITLLPGSLSGVPMSTREGDEAHPSST